uniref:Uncharacterized protein n=1 Tax=Panagrolaimus sp. PS1159 TaxID=55785 RepID=A0AC35F624_9BILA
MFLLILFLGFIPSGFGVFPSTAGKYGQLIDVARQMQTSVNIQSGQLYQLDGGIADQSILSIIDRNLTSLRNPIRGLEGFMDRLQKNQQQSVNNALQPISDSKSKIKNPPKASTLVRSGKLRTANARQWLQTCATFLQTTIKTLSTINSMNESGRQSPSSNNDANSLTNIYG